MIFTMMVVLKRTHKYILLRFLSVCALVFAVGIAKVQHIDAAGIDTTSIQKVFSSANVTGVGNKKLAVTSYSQAYYQAYYQSYYQSYYQGSYNLTFSRDVSALGDLSVATNIGKGSGTFVIDHPLDPLNKLLYHSFVESPDVKNWYDGVTTLDKEGKATVRLPSYFDALNTDVRYQIKPIDASMPELFIAEEEKNNMFVIAGGVPNGRVSWQVTGIRKDPYILAHPIIVEVEKGPDQIVNKGEYLFPEGYPAGLAEKMFSNVAQTIRSWFSK